MYTHHYFLCTFNTNKPQARSSQEFIISPIEFQQNPYTLMKTNNWTPSKYAF